MTEPGGKPKTVKYGSGQRMDKRGRIKVGVGAWTFRILILIALVAYMAYTVRNGIETGDPFLITAIIFPIHALNILVVGWLFFKTPAVGKLGDDPVTVIIPVFNQHGMIETVIDAIFRSTYKNIEVVAVNDGSKDGTNLSLNKLAAKYPRLKVIHKKNEGKRKAIAAAFYNS